MTGFFTDHLWLVPVLPLFGALVIMVFGRRLGEPQAGWLASFMTIGSFLITVSVFFNLLSRPAEERHQVVTMFKWLPVGSLQVDMALLADPLSITMALFITGIGSLIHLYAIGYMHGDPKFSKFFLYLNLFVFSMLMLVLGENLLVTFLGWEGVGACSYFLISFWHTRDSAAVAGKKAFVTNRIGDFGVMTAMFLAFSAVGTLSYDGINEAAHSGSLAPVTATAIAMLLFVGACGKSAQLPLYLWLPDAMEGPTPVSALIHAATMVTSGVFLMTRMSPVLHESYSWAPTVIACVGAATGGFSQQLSLHRRAAMGVHPGWSDGDRLAGWCLAHLQAGRAFLFGRCAARRCRVRHRHPRPLEPPGRAGPPTDAVCQGLGCLVLATDLHGLHHGVDGRHHFRHVQVLVEPRNVGPLQIRLQVKELRALLLLQLERSQILD